MATDPNLIKEVVDGAVNTVNNGIKTIGDTLKHNKKEAEQTKRKKSEEENDTIKHTVTANKENRDAEIHANENIVNQSTGNMKDVAIDTVTGSLEMIGDATDKVAEVSNKSIDHIKEIVDANAQIEESHQQKIREYQGMLQQASIEITQYRTAREIHNQFSQNILNFAEVESIHRQKVSDTKNQYNRIKVKLQPFQNDFQEIKTQMAILESHYEKLHQEFDKQIHSLELLKYEYKDSMDEAKYHESYKRKNRELKHFCYEIEHKELELLNKERDRLNKLEEMEPMVEALEEHKIALEYLESEHARLISVGTHQISNVQTLSENINSKDTAELIDVSSSDIPKINNLLSEKK